MGLGRVAFVARVVAVDGRIGLRAGGGTRGLCGTRELDADKTGRDVEEVVELVVVDAVALVLVCT